MKVAIIADDLTGANDSGVQFARYGLKTSVLLDKNPDALERSDVIIFDTDSRSIPPEEAYTRVKEVAEFLSQNKFELIFKKIDSTMRGNVGIEIKAVYEVFQPDFVIIAPGFPKNQRQIINGYHYLNNRLLHETEVALDPKTPVKESFLPKLLREQNVQNVAHINFEELYQGASYLSKRFNQFKKENIKYVLFDSRSEEDLKQAVNVIREIGLSVIWAGSAGLAEVFPEYLSLQRKEWIPPFAKGYSPSLLVMGSVSSVGRQQLENVLADPRVQGIQMSSERVVTDFETRNTEIQRIYDEASKAIEKGKHIALYSSGGSEDIRLAFQAGERIGLNHTDICNIISQYLGSIASRLINHYPINRVILTGGDTAKQVFRQIGASEFILLDEIEPGVPIGYVNSSKIIYAVTKAGSFGSLVVFTKAMQKLQG